MRYLRRTTKIEKVCEECNNIFCAIKPNQIYCSKKCWNSFRKRNNIKIGGLPKKEKKNCLRCGKLLHRHGIIYCSRHCARIGNENKKGKSNKDLNEIRIIKKPKIISYGICDYCKKEYEKKRSEQRFCSNKCCSLDPIIIEKKKAAGRKAKGRKFSPEIIEKMSIAASKRAANYNFTRGIGGFREDIGHYVRSSWEANIARILKYENIDYKYEQYIIQLNDNGKKINYITDFQIGEHFIEVKGWWDEKSLKKKKLLEEQYPDLSILYISEIEYLELQKFYKDKIHEWEFKRSSRRNAQ